MAIAWSTILSGVTAPFFDTVKSVIDKTITDKNARASAVEALDKARQDQEAALLKAVTDNANAQIEVNRTEASHASLFVAGWRPAIGWICGGSLAWQFILQPIATWFITVAQGIWQFTVPAFPILDNESLYTVLLGMLGLGGLRTYERVKGNMSRSSLKNDSIDTE